MKYYKINNLYVGLLGIVKEDNSIDMPQFDNFKRLQIKSINKYIIYKKVPINNIWVYDCLLDYGAKDIFTDIIYYFFSGNIMPKDTIEKSIGRYAICESFPIETYLDFPKKKASRSELLVILDKLNNPHKGEKVEVPTEPITDSILKTILETSDLVKVSNISDELKENTINELEVLAENYVSDINNFNNNNELNPFYSEYQIRMTYIKALVDIEQKINDPKQIKSYSLKKQLQTFKKELNQND